MTNKVTVPRALGIKCAYTGSVVDIYLTVAGGQVLYSCPKAFTLAEPVGTLQELQDRASMRNGVAGVARTGDPVDAYTGKPLRLRVYPDGRFSYAGGFNPRRAFTDLDELLYYLTMRNGVASRAKPAPKPAVAAAKADTAARPDARTTPSDATLEEMERVAAGHMQRGTVVSMAPSARKSPAPRGPANRHARTGGK